MAVGVGFLVGYAVRFAGKGVDPIFAYTGAALALLGCLAGNLFTALGVACQQGSVGFVQLLLRLNPSIAGRLLAATFSPMDLLFYGIAVYEGYKFSLQRLTPAEIASLRA
jgi:hypothetical protein